MDRCLSIPEILHLIFCDIEKESRSEREKYRTLLSAASVSHAWSQVALDYLWRSICGVHCLIRCMPNLWTIVDRELILTRSLKASDLHVLEKYTPRVRTLIVGSSGPIVPLWVYQALLLSSQHPLLPNLEVLEWRPSSDQVNYFPFVRSFMASGLKDLELVVNFKEYDQVSFLTIVPRLCPNITRLCLGMTGYRDTLAVGVENFSDIFHDWHNLTTLVVTDLTLDGLVCVAAMSSLRSLEIQRAKCLWKSSLSGDKDPTRLLNALESLNPPFPALQSLEITTRMPVAIVTNLLALLRNAELIRLTVSVDSITDTVDDLAKLFLVLAEHCDHGSLKKIIFGHSNPRVIFPFLVLQPLLQFSALQYIDIELSPAAIGLTVSENQMLQMVSAWPDIRVLRITPDAGRNLNSPTTLLALLPIIKCTKLRHLGLSLDATDAAARRVLRDPGRPKGQRNYTLRTLDVGIGSPISHKEFVAKFLSESFPNLDDIASDGSPDSSTTRRWRYVARVLLPLLGGNQMECGNMGFEGAVGRTANPVKGSAREWAEKVEKMDGDWSDPEIIRANLATPDIDSDWFD
ncbi:hypothetical protein P691DRAFT_773118 [Macrolepiota fuliginosa MF-IS2]|uniref:F-box domain-containing protein n=1 Tax=Macrolepiota fuliginosa MF-IS2 TaxID=1400762 RepID=A0A9P6C726_9AGAR|nr:hypothetical protein P691DRAFT_773118 [Macrolepiota fuliginosa MF-IS2]